MRNDRLLVFLIIADFALVLLTIGAEVVLNWTLPQPLRPYGIFGEGSVADLVLLPLYIGIVVMTMVSWIGLLNYWWPARILYIAAWLGWLLLTVLAGPSVMTAGGAALEMLENLVGGAIICLVFASDLSKRFEERAGLLYSA